MDGTIIDTEDLYTECSNELLGMYGKGPMTWDVKIKLQGRPGPVANQIMIETYELPLTVKEFADLSYQIQETKWPKANFLPGALELIQHLHSSKVPIAVGTSSNKVNYHRKTGHLGHGFDLFGKHVVTGDDPRIPKGRGKPSPDIWFACLKSLNDDRTSQGLDEITIDECLVFEDGVVGVESGIAAKSTVIWIPHPESLPLFNGKEHEIIGENGEILKNLEHFDRQRYGL